MTIQESGIKIAMAELIISLITYDKAHGDALSSELRPAITNGEDDLLKHVTAVRVNEPCVWEAHAQKLSGLLVDVYGEDEAAASAQRHITRIQEAGAVAIGAVIGDVEPVDSHTLHRLRSFLYQTRKNTWKVTPCNFSPGSPLNP